jgi:membrane-bound serine protease (ClpP class)
MKKLSRIMLLGAVLVMAARLSISAQEEVNLPTLPLKGPVQAAVIVCKGMIDDGLYKSIKRRTEIALKGGVDYLIYEIETYGGEVAAADDISKYFILDVAKRAHTVAYVNTEAISAGAMISVSCEDIIMRENTTIGDCAPITLGGKLEGVEREKVESFVRATFARAAEANKYPMPLLKAMVTVGTEVYRVKNTATGQWEYFETEQLPKDANAYDLEGKERVVSSKELLTLTASKAAEYGIARAVVKDVNGALSFLEKRDGVEFSEGPVKLETNWSEEMVRWLNSPAVMGVLVTIALLGLYIEFQTPGVWLPGLVAVICFVLIVGSRFLTGMANWVEVALFITGVLLLLIEVFLIPGFGFAGFIGIVLILAGLFGMLIKNPPDQLPWPQTDFDWQLLTNQIWAIGLGFLAFLVLAGMISKYLPKTTFFSRLMLSPKVGQGGTEVNLTAPPDAGQINIKVGQIGEATSRLRPAGKARFAQAVVDVVTEGSFVDKGARVMIMEISGNRVVVREAEQGNS